uniref:Uncharacterized protein n=1 Tax=Erwinia amylovora ATCC BAA-2158 TaxID=889211 RepID=E5B215_ERWAM|nr:hypothetical protein predicted by Glimmer/Critica [Erwinia amylovora ATCC BAA-2158]
MMALLSHSGTREKNICFISLYSSMIWHNPLC